MVSVTGWNKNNTMKLSKYQTMYELKSVLSNALYIQSRITLIKCTYNKYMPTFEMIPIRCSILDWMQYVGQYSVRINSINSHQREVNTYLSLVYFQKCDKFKWISQSFQIRRPIKFYHIFVCLRRFRVCWFPNLGVSWLGLRTAFST